MTGGGLGKCRLEEGRRETGILGFVGLGWGVLECGGGGQ